MMKSKWNDEKEKLEQLILIDKVSYEEIGRQYGCSGNNIKKVAVRLGINIIPRRVINENENFNKGKHFKDSAICLGCGKEFYVYTGSTGKYCSCECQQKARHKEKYQLILKGDPSIMRANYSPKNFREDILKEQNGLCAICGMSPEWNKKPLVFIIDHIDGHASNNIRSNLRCICPNCDSQLDTYKSKNKCGERSYYRYHKENQNEN